MFSFNKFALAAAVTLVGTVAMARSLDAPAPAGHVLPVVSANGSAPALSAVRHTGSSRHHARRHHRAHAVRPVRR